MNSSMTRRTIVTALLILATRSPILYAAGNSPFSGLGDAVSTESPSADDQPAAIAWHTNVFEAYQKAVREHKPLVVLFYSDECDHCVMFKSEVLSTDAFGSFADDAVFAAIDCDNLVEGSQEERLYNELKIEGVPTISVMNAHTDALVEVGRMIGNLSLQEALSQFFGLIRGWDKAQVARA